MPSIQTASKSLLTAQFKELCVKLTQILLGPLLQLLVQHLAYTSESKSQTRSLYPPRYPHESPESAADLQGPSMSVSQTERKRSFKIQDQFGSVVF